MQKLLTRDGCGESQIARRYDTAHAVSKAGQKLEGCGGLGLFDAIRRGDRKGVAIMAYHRRLGGVRQLYLLTMTPYENPLHQTLHRVNMQGFTEPIGWGINTA